MADWRDLAGALGFNALLLKGRAPLFSDDGGECLSRISDAAGSAQDIYVEVDLSRFPIDHPLVDAHPYLFAVRRSRAELESVDPRRALPATGEALARTRAPEAADILLGPILQSLDRLIASGVRGVRLLEVQRVGPQMLERICEHLRLRNIRSMAGPLPDRSTARKLNEAGLDQIVSSFGWWDFRASWLAEEADALRGASLLAEFHEQSRLPACALLASVVAADGFIVPENLLRAPETRAAAREAVKALAAMTGYDGDLRQVTGPGAPVTALVRADTPDARTATSVVCALVNPGAQVLAAPRLPALLQPLGATFDGFESLVGDDGGSLTVLAPNRTRLVRGARAKTITPLRDEPSNPSAARQWPRLVVEAVSPSVEGGDFPVKRVVGDLVEVTANVFTDGHEQLAVELLWRPADEPDWRIERMAPAANDAWSASFPLERLGRHAFAVEGWLDRYGGYCRDLKKKRDAAVAQSVDYAEGIALITQAAARARGSLATALRRACAAVESAPDDEVRGERLLADELRELMDQADDRPHVIRSSVQQVDSERLAARFSSWYELFPRSQSNDKARHGAFSDVIARMPAVRDMGFDTLYFPPIHPIGTTNRKGPNNSLTSGADDPGSPYAIGSAEGGHDAIHPQLGSFEDFDRMVAAARDHGLEIALDFAIQASPDHPWLTEHPGWFAWRPDGSMKYAENPPKKYQDIVNVDFYAADAVPGLWLGLRDVVLLWIEHGVKVFRVDNPHTKPLPFWEWMIADVRARHPEVIFLAEAFTRPNMMYRLAKVGFSQSYTYFTWRDRKQELIDYITELTTTAPKEFYRPHFFVNTPDINPPFLQTSGRPGFQMRAVLAATLSGLFGVYSGFELCESAPAPGKAEEYLDSEKYEIRPRNWNAPGNIIADITLLNRLRRANPALQTHLNTRFYVAHNDNIIWYGKPSAEADEMIMVMVNLDPHNAQEADFELPLWEFGLPDDGRLAVEDLVQGRRFDWQGKIHHIRIAPDLPYRIWRVASGGTA